ncbi:DNA-binding protein [Streptomyces violascens]|nr:DNA-binding protein [Streptomyces violascens]
MSLEELLSLPVAVSVSTAARALAIGKDKAYSLIKAGTFPAKTFPAGGTLRVSTPSLWKVLDVSP